MIPGLKILVGEMTMTGEGMIGVMMQVNTVRIKKITWIFLLVRLLLSVCCVAVLLSYIDIKILIVKYVNLKKKNVLFSNFDDNALSFTHLTLI